MINRDGYNKTAKKDVLRRLGREARGKQLDVEKINTTTPVSPEVPVSVVQEKLQPSRKKVNLSLMLALVFCVGLISLWILYKDEVLDLFQPRRDYILSLVPNSFEDAPVLPAVDPSLSSCIRSEYAEDPEINAQAYIAVYEEDFQVVIQYNANRRLSFASIAKLMSVLVSLESYDTESELALLTAVDSQGSGMDLSVGESVRVYDLVAAAIVGSKNDAIYALAQNFPGGEAAFVLKMNEKAVAMGLTGTNFVNPAGFDDPNQYSNVRDLAILSIVAMRHPVIKELASLMTYELTTSTGRIVEIDTTNGLLGEVGGVVGIKTGYTESAGLCLASYFENGRDFVTVVLNAEDRVEESKKLIEWVEQNYNCP